MIRLDRGRVPAPGVLSSARAQEWMHELRQAFAEGELPRRSKGRRQWARPEVREALLALGHGKCAYCETPVAASGAMELEHFRPKRRVTQANGRVHPMHYAWLELDWDNLLPSCRDCNRLKGSRFPIHASPPSPSPAARRSGSRARCSWTPAWTSPPSTCASRTRARSSGEPSGAARASRSWA